MQFWILVLALTLGAYNAHAQRVYAPEITGPGHVKYENETLVFVLSPDKIEKIETSEYQVHIQMTQAAREYFYTLTKLNVGKKMIIKSGGGETIQEAIIQKPIDSGIIISRPIKDSRAELARFLKRIVTGQEPIEIKPRDIYVEENYNGSIHTNQLTRRGQAPTMQCLERAQGSQWHIDMKTNFTFSL